MYVTEIGNDRIQVFDKDGAFLTTWGKKGSQNGEFGNLHGMIVDKETGWVYVADPRTTVFRSSSPQPPEADPTQQLRAWPELQPAMRIVEAEEGK